MENGKGADTVCPFAVLTLLAGVEASSYPVPIVYSLTISAKNDTKFATGTSLKKIADRMIAVKLRAFSMTNGRNDL